MSAERRSEPDDQGPAIEDDHGILDGLFSEADGTPVGDTPEVHDEITPADVPADNPMRRELEREPSTGQDQS